MQLSNTLPSATYTNNLKKANQAPPPRAGLPGQQPSHCSRVSSLTPALTPNTFHELLKQKHFNNPYPGYFTTQVSVTMGVKCLLNTDYNSQTLDELALEKPWEMLEMVN